MPEPVTIPVSQLVRILIVEDEQGVADGLRDVLELQGYSVQVASSPEEAKLCLEANEFAMLISDQNFDGPAMGGDAFLLDTAPSVKNGAKVLMTGKAMDRIKRRDELRERGIRILVKGEENFTDDLEQMASEVFRARKDKVHQVVKSLIDSVDSPDSSGSKELVDQARTLLLAWLERKREKDDLGIYYAGRTYSTRMLIDEIERQSEVGKAHISMFMQVMRKAMRI